MCNLNKLSQTLERWYQSRIQSLLLLLKLEGSGYEIALVSAPVGILHSETTNVEDE